MTIIGYIRAIRQVDRDEQDRQLAAEGVGSIYYDNGPAGVADRPGLAEAIGSLSRSDILIAASASVLADNAAALVDVLDQVRARGAALVILDLGGTRLDSSTTAGKLMARMLCAVATFKDDARAEHQGT